MDVSSFYETVAFLRPFQILESIDEPRCQRLEQPVHCPREHYNVMLQTWRHEPSKRPTFEQVRDEFLVSIVCTFPPFNSYIPFL